MLTQKQIDTQTRKTLEAFLNWRINQQALDELETEYKKQEKAKKTHREIQLLFCEYMEDINYCFENKSVLSFHEILEDFFHEVKLLEKQYYYNEDA